MPSVCDSYVLVPGQVERSVLWVRPGSPDGFPCCDDRVMEAIFGGLGRSRRLVTLGRAADGSFWMATRSGTDLHYDPGYVRYSAQLVVRNDGFRLHGMVGSVEDYPLLFPGTMAGLDTWSPHRLCVDGRFGVRRPLYKLSLAVDSPSPVGFEEATSVLLPRARSGEDVLRSLSLPGALHRRGGRA